MREYGQVSGGRLLVGAAALLLAATTGVRAQEELKIGLPIELSGRYVAYGAQVKKGVETAVEVWKANRGDKVAGRPIALVIRDVQSNNTATVSVMNELIASDKVNVIIGPGGSNVGAAAVPPWKKAAERPVWIVPGVSTTVVEKEIGKDPYFFHTFAWTYHYHATNVAALKAAIGADHKKVAIIYSDGAYGRAHVDYARKYLKEAGFEIVTEELIREGAPDFTPALLKIRARKPDILYTLVQTDDAILLGKQIHTAKMNTPYLIGTFQATLPEWKEALGEVQTCWTGVSTYLPGAIYAADKAEPKLFPAAAEWEDSWRKKYSKEPEYMEAGAYVSAMLALLAVEKANSTDRDKIEAAMSAASYGTVLGNSKFEASEVALHQAFGKMVVFQQQKVGGAIKSAIIYPPEASQAKLMACAN
jgi:branched-chain amino acid transport system substrate-binding protein